MPPLKITCLISEGLNTGLGVDLSYLSLLGKVRMKK